MKTHSSDSMLAFHIYPNIPDMAVSILSSEELIMKGWRAQTLFCCVVDTSYYVCHTTHLFQSFVLFARLVLAPLQSRQSTVIDISNNPEFLCKRMYILHFLLVFLCRNISFLQQKVIIAGFCIFCLTFALLLCSHPTHSQINTKINREHIPKFS